ncbi:MAG: SGNH/GDSL hydrolase family protein [Bacteroidota bacterium]
MARRLGRWAGVLALALLAGCTTFDPVEDEPVTVEYLALGDSYTIGEAVEVVERWPMQLAERLRTAGYTVEEPMIVAETGWTTDELDEGITRAGVRRAYNLVSLLIGVNNQFRGQSIDDYRITFRDLLQRAIGFAQDDASRVFVVSIPDYGNTPFGADDAERIGRELDAFNAVSVDEARQAGVAYVSITAISRQPYADWVASDALHPSGAQYAAWVDAIEPVVLDLLRAR